MPLQMSEFKMIAPLIFISIAGFLAPLMGVFLNHEHQKRFSMVFVLLASFIGISLCVLPVGIGPVLSNMLMVDHFSLGMSMIVLLFLAMSAPMFFKANFVYDDQPSLVAGLILLSASGAMLMGTSANLLLVFLGLEILSIPLYVLISIGQTSYRSSEASFKYFILGAIASALFVYGMALLWGESGTLNIIELSRILFDNVPDSQLTILGFVLVAVAMFFKLGLAPFQMWIPDVYEAAPSSLNGWMSSAVKLSALVVLLRFSTYVGAGAFEFKWLNVIKVVAALSMLWGSVGALFQKNVKRLLAYSSISHAGYLSMLLLSASQGSFIESTHATLLYVLTYGLASFVTFVVVSFLEEGEMNIEIKHLKGLYEKYPSLAVAMSIALLSLAGLPPLAGFVAKYQVFSSVLQYGHFKLLLVALLSSVLSLGYYLKIVLHIMTEPSFVAPDKAKKFLWAPAIASCAIIILGVMPWKWISIVQDFWK